MISLLDLTEKRKKKVGIGCLQNSAKPYLTASNCLGLSTLMGPETPASMIQPGSSTASYWPTGRHLTSRGSRLLDDVSKLSRFLPAE